MEKASKALRRSGVRIKSIGSGYSDLQMVISQLKDVRAASKAFSTAQSSAMQDVVKWSLKDENRAIQDALTQVGELFSVWTEVQREFSSHIKEFQHQFDMILEGAKQLDFSKAELQSAEQKEGKLKKEIKKAAKKATPEELRDMTVKLREAEREKDNAQLEVVDKIREHEAVKMIRIKEGFFKLSEAYIDCAQKCDVIFGAQRDIALQIPDVQDRDIQDIKYTGAGSTQQSVARAKAQIQRFRRRPTSSPGLGRRPSEDLPPPYSENPPINPNYSDLHLDTSGDHSLDHSSSLDDSRPLVVSPPSHAPPLNLNDPLYQSHLYPLLHPIAPPYPSHHQQPGDLPPPFHQHVVIPSSHPFLRREDSYLSDGEASDAVAGLANLHLQPNPR